MVGHVTAERFETMMKLRVLESLAQPGEGVGLIAAQVRGTVATPVVLMYKCSISLTLVCLSGKSLRWVW